MQDCRPVVFISDSLPTVLNWQSIILNIKQNRLTAHNAYFCITLMVHISAICRFTDRLLARPRTEIRTRDWRSIIIISIILLRIEILTFSQSQMIMLNYWAISDGNAQLLSYLWWKCSPIEAERTTQKSPRIFCCFQEINTCILNRIMKPFIFFFHKLESKKLVFSEMSKIHARVE